jgi:hypothetical protein
MEFGRAEGRHDRVENTKLTGGQSTNHDTTGEKTDRAEFVKPNLTGNLHQAGHHGPFATGALLVDF